VSALSLRDIGHRVVVRHRLADDPEGHRFTDVLGVLQTIEADSLVVRRADSTLLRVAVSDIAAAKPIPPVPLRRVDVDQLFLTTALGRPAVETSYVGEWLLRASGGWTGRANSLLPAGDPGIAVPEALSAVVDFYRARDLPPLALVRSDSHAAGELRRYGWIDARPGQSDTLVLHTSLDVVNAEPLLEVRIGDQPDDDWYAAAFDGEPPAPARVVMESAPRAAFASIRLDGRTVAVGRGSMTGHWIGIDSVRVDEAYRRRGLGTAIVRGLTRWAGALGGRRTYLEVLEENTAALTAYRNLGYAEAYRYRYLTDPSA
jgi:ribosomal protein S18 acetylase RimI-like enzyme